MAKKQRPVISLIAIRKIGDNIEVLLQTRSKKADDTPYHGYFELPQGKIEAGENITVAATRELDEETGLTLDEIRLGCEESFSVVEATSDLFTCHPLICVVDRIQNHLALAIIVTVSGQVSRTSEASNHQWVSLAQLRTVFDGGRIFPLNRPMVAEFLRSPEQWLRLL